MSDIIKFSWAAVTCWLICGWWYCRCGLMLDYFTAIYIWKSTASVKNISTHLNSFYDIYACCFLESACYPPQSCIFTPYWTQYANERNYSSREFGMLEKKKKSIWMMHDSVSFVMVIECHEWQRCDWCEKSQWDHSENVSTISPWQ